MPDSEVSTEIGNGAADWLWCQSVVKLSSGASTDQSQDDGIGESLIKDKGGAPSRRRHRPSPWLVARGSWTCPFLCRTIVDCRRRHRRVAKCVESIFAYHFIYRRPCYSPPT